MDTSNISDKRVREFLEAFFIDRSINKEFYRRVPDDQFDFRMVDAPTRRSDTPKESLVHQIVTTQKYINGVKTGEIRFTEIPEENIALMDDKSKDELIEMMEDTEKELIELLKEEKNAYRKVKVPWVAKPIDAIQALWGLHNHEILHTGWNLAIMDHLDMERFPALREQWG